MFKISMFRGGDPKQWHFFFSLGLGENVAQINLVAMMNKHIADLPSGKSIKSLGTIWDRLIQ